MDADGVVTTVSAGEAVISAVKAGDDAFLESNIATYDIVAELREQPLLAFESGLVQLIFGEKVPANALTGGAGKGAVTYKIDNGSIDTISADGVVTAVAPGFTFVSAVKAADGTFGPSNTANYELLISEESAECVFDQSAWDDCELSQ